MYHVITDEKYMIWYTSITRRVITLDPEQVPPPRYMQYEQHVQQIQNLISNQIFS
jgi:hypothetical protein